MRFAIYTDYPYSIELGEVFGERAFVTFLAEVARLLDGAVVLGRLNPKPGRFRYRLPGWIDFVPLPYYERAVSPLRSGRAMLGALSRFWETLDRVDGAWVLGPHPVAVGFAILTLIRRKRLVLGVRQDYPAYVRARYPGRRWVHVAAFALHRAFHLLSRRHPVVVVGSELARDYRRAGRLLSIAVSLVPERSLSDAAALERRYDGDLRVLSVGRLEAEKNPLLLADILALLNARNSRWRLVICGEGDMRARLEERLKERGVWHCAELCGYVPLDAGLYDLYRTSHLLLHVSWTEGFPQVLVEAFAAALPAVATAVGGVPGLALGAAVLVPPGDAEAAARGLESLAKSEPLRARLTASGLDRARRYTLERESKRVVEFLTTRAPPRHRRLGG